jgi:hypothetical protein
MNDTPPTLARRHHLMILQASRETVKRSYEVLAATKHLVSSGPAGPLVGARRIDSGESDHPKRFGAEPSD